MSLQVVSREAATVVDLETAKAWLRIDNPDEDARVQLLVDAATEYVAEHVRMLLSPCVMRLILDGFPVINWYQYFPVMAPFPQLLTQGMAFFLPTQTISEPVYPVTSIDSIQYLDTNEVLQTLDASQYTVDLSTQRQAPAANQVWPGTANQIAAVTINFHAGFALGEAPHWVRQLILNHCLLSYYSPGGIAAKDMENLNKAIESHRVNLLV